MINKVAIFWILAQMFSFLLTLAKWSPALQVRTVLLSIQALLASPNSDDFLATAVAVEWKQNEAGALQTGKFSDSPKFGLN